MYPVVVYKRLDEKVMGYKWEASALGCKGFGDTKRRARIDLEASPTYIQKSKGVYGDADAQEELPQ